jgi:hypothetical protein
MAFLGLRKWPTPVRQIDNDSANLFTYAPLFYPLGSTDHGPSVAVFCSLSHYFLWRDKGPECFNQRCVVERRLSFLFAHPGITPPSTGICN